MTKTIKARKLHERDMANPAYKAAYDSMEAEFSLIQALIGARKRADLSQAELAARMGTTESVISRLESGRVKPSTRTLERYAKATGHFLRLSLEPSQATPR
jgi:ribosome-binding protein aMBF1 (putative translation factor)